MNAFASLFSQNKNKLIVTTNCGPDNEFNSPKEARWSAALGKVLVANGGSTNNYCVRNSNLTFYSKFWWWSLAMQAIDADANYIYAAVSSIRRFNLDWSNGTTFSILGNGGARMIDASGDPDYVYVTSNNATDGHGVRKVRKSDMTVVASILATGAGDGQFNNPKGIFYYAGFAYVADTGNTRIVKLNASGANLTFDSNIDFGGRIIEDLCTDGLNWYMCSASTVYQSDMLFTYATRLSAACVSYSLCIIPDQGDGNGATLGIVNNTGSCLYRLKCSDLSLIATVGSAGDGSASLFDPTFTTSTPHDIDCVTDCGTFRMVRSGAGPYTYAFSWNGFAGITYPTAGPHRAVFKGVPLSAITVLNDDSDLVKFIKNLEKCVNLTQLSSYTTNDRIPISKIAGLGNLLRLNGKYEGSVDSLACKSKLTGADFGSSSTYLTGSLAGFDSMSTSFTPTSTAISGSLSDLSATNTIVHAYLCTGITPGSIAHLIAIRDLRIYGMGWTAQQNTDVLLSAWAARANYTYASGIQLRISAPTGTPGTEPPAEEGPGHDTSDWAWNAGTSRYDPLTGYAVISDLQTDFYSEGFKPWAVTIV
jgi:hypothetical protein